MENVKNLDFTQSLFYLIRYRLKKLKFINIVFSLFELVRKANWFKN